MKQTIVVFLLAISTSAYCQKQTLNLDFEKSDNGTPSGWTTMGSSNYSTLLDSTVTKNGHFAAVLKYNDGAPDFSAWSYTLPHNYKGKKIKLTGYIKTENITDGYAGLWMRIDPQIGFDNMDGSGIKGTTDWRKVDITLDMKPDNTEQIVVGGILQGNGKMWLDDLKVSIDGMDIENLQPYVRYAAELDKTFDKGSQVTNINTDEKNIQNLQMLGLIWGYLKYYHPAIAAGNYNWDYELFRILPKVIATKNNLERDALFVDWIKHLGSFTEGKEKPLKQSLIKMQPDLVWIQNSGLSEELTSLLLRVRNAIRTDKHFYIEFPKQGAQNPEFKNEKAYQAMKYPDLGYRLLALYRYWNIIQYFFPYKNLIEEDWKLVLREFIPKFIGVTNETEYTLTAVELIARVHDTHANAWGNPILNNYWGRNTAATEVSFIENNAVVTGYYNDTLGNKTGLQRGDIIVAINGKAVNEIIKNQLKLTAASNYPTQLRDIARRLLKTNDTTLSIDFTRDGTKHNATINAYPPGKLDVYSKYRSPDTCFRLLDNNIAYLNNGTLKSKYLPGIWKHVQNTRGLIIDDRNYPSEMVLFPLCNYLFGRSTSFVKFSVGSLTTPGLFTYTEPKKAGKQNKDAYKGKVIILTNEISQSSSEYHAMAYRAVPNAIVIGSTTAGADGNVSRFFLPGGILTMFSGIGVYYPGGRETQRVGIVPDIEVRPTIKGIKEGRDELLEKAIQIINQ